MINFQFLKHSLFFVITFFILTPALSFEILKLDPSSERINITSKYYLYKDSKKTSHIDIFLKDETRFLYEVDTSILYSKYRREMIWGKIYIHNLSNDKKRYILNNSGITHSLDIVVYDLNGKVVSKGKSGLDKSRNGKSKFIDKIQIEIQPNQKVVLVFGYRSNSLVSLNLLLHSPNDYLEWMEKKQVIYAASLGVMVAIAFFSILLFFVSFEINYILLSSYSLSLVVVLLYTFTPFGSLMHNVFPELSNYIFQLVIVNSSIGLSFLYHNLTYDQNSSIFKDINRFVLLVLFGLFICSFIFLESFSFLFLIYDYLISLACLFYLLTFLYLYAFIGIKRFKYLMIGLIPFSLIVLPLNILKSMEITIPEQLFGDLQVISLAFFIFFSAISLSHRINILRMHLIKKQREKDDDLKQMVEDQTNRILENKILLRYHKQSIMLGEVVRSVLSEISPYQSKLISSSSKLKKYFEEKLIPLDNKVFIALDRINNSSERMEIIQNSFLMLSSSKSDIENNKSRFNTIDLNNILEKSIIKSKRSNADIKFILPKDLGCVLIGIEDQLQSIFENIICNAVESIERNKNKNSNHDFVEVILRTIDFESKIIVLTIMDSGFGVCSDEFHHVCGPFYTKNQLEGHLGLGLFDVKNIIEIHDGNVEFVFIEDNAGFYPQLTFVMG